MGIVEKGVAKITFCCYVGESQFVVPLNSLKTFVFETMAHETEFCLRMQNKDKTGGYAANPSDPWHDDVYFDSYAWMQIHWEMLSDYKRCQAYYHALERFSEDVKGKVVLDVGCGTGILSDYAMKCGAKKVYAIDASSIVAQAELILNKNGCENVVELIHGKIEEIILPVKEVDLIVSEWMGYFLLCESMLETVIHARDKWLAPGGKMFPCEAKLYLVPVYYNHYYSTKVKFFEQFVDGVDVSPLLPYASEEFTTRTLRCFDLPVSEILAEPEIIKFIDVYTVTKQDCRRTHKKFKFAISQNQNFMFKWPHSPKGTSKSVSLACSSDGWLPHSMSFQDDLWRVSLCLPPGIYQYKFIVDGVWMHDKFAETIQNHRNTTNLLTISVIDRTNFNGFGSWFDVTFKGSNPTKDPVVLSTDPRQGYQTSWKQDICLYGRSIEIGEAAEIGGSIQVQQMKTNLRHFLVSIGCTCNGDYNYRGWCI
jgi:predicted RNA methylase